MKAEIKQLWLDALRSGEYTQGRGALSLEHVTTKKREFCCLGVLCDLYAKQHTISWDTAPMFKLKADSISPLGKAKVGFFGTDAFLPKIVMDWAGLDKPNPTVFKRRKNNTLADLNDMGRSFRQIAAIIEKKL